MFESCRAHHKIKRSQVGSTPTMGANPDPKLISKVCWYSMQKDYLTRAEGAYRIGHTRVSLDSLVYLFREGTSAESMVDSYPALTLEQVMEL
jgi:hypothetical protein